jgi:hypothetical protein
LERLYWSDIPVWLQRCVVALLAFVLLAVVLLFGMRYRAAVKEARAAEAREITYQQALQPYVARFKRDTPRGEIQRYLRENGVKFTHLCCMGVSHNAMDTLVKIGEEPPPRFCGEQHVYVGFEFVSTRVDWMPKTHDSDTLTVVRLFRFSDGCS